MSEPAEASRFLAGTGPAIAELEALGPIDWTAWDRAARELAGRLPAGPDLDRRIHQLYLPVLFFCLAWLKRSAARPLMVGLQAPQGSGKTTLVSHSAGAAARAGAHRYGRVDRRLLSDARAADRARG